MENELDWIDKIEPRKVWDILVEQGLVPASEKDREYFASCWAQNWGEWRLDTGYFGFGLKIWREKRVLPNVGYAPCLRINCYREDSTIVAETFIENAERALLELLISIGLHKPA